MKWLDNITDSMDMNFKSKLQRQWRTGETGATVHWVPESDMTW